MQNNKVTTIKLTDTKELSSTDFLTTEIGAEKEITEKKPIDILDAQCKKHDNCYSANGMWNSKCDVQFVYNIARNFGAINKIGWRARTYAVAAMLLFAGKVGGTSALKAKYPILRPFLP